MSKQPIAIFGLDVGKRKDPASLLMCYMTTGPDDRHLYEVAFARQWELGTPYPELATEVRKTVHDPQVDQASASLAIDITTVGEPVADMICDGLQIPEHRIWITGGNNWRRDEDDGCYYVSKNLLVSCVKMLFGQRRLTFVKELKLCAMILSEIDSFQVKVSKAANELYEAREGKHDDLILALAVMCWAGENLCLGPWDGTPNIASRSVVDRAPRGVFLDGPDDEDGEGGRTLWRAPSQEW